MSVCEGSRMLSSSSEHREPETCGLVTRQTWLDPWLCHLLAVCPGASHSASLDLGFLICKMNLY